MSTKCIVLVLSTLVASLTAQNSPPYVKKQCRESDPKLMACLTEDLNYLKPWLAKGIPEIKMPTIEPFNIDELSLALSTGPTGYRINLKNIEIFGASNYTVSKLKLSENGQPFEARVKMPQLRIMSKYTSSGVLFIIPASGNGTFHATFDGASAYVRGTVSTSQKPEGKYLRVETLDVDLHVKNVHMMVRKVFNNNRILIEASNLFLRENGKEVLNAMLPQLRVQLGKVFKKIVNNLTTNVPLHHFYLEN